VALGGSTMEYVFYARSGGNAIQFYIPVQSHQISPNTMYVAFAIPNVRAAQHISSNGNKTILNGVITFPFLPEVFSTSLPSTLPS